MSCFRSSRLLLKHTNNVVKLNTRRSFTSTNSTFNPLQRKLKLVGFALAGSSLVGFGVVVYCDAPASEPKKKLVILGSGWGAVSLIKSLKVDSFDISVVSPHNYFLFTPLLPSVTVGTVEGRSITESIRKILFRSHPEATFYEAECTRVDPETNQVYCTDQTDIVGAKTEFALDYDYLVVAVGAQTQTYNIKGVAQHAHYLKDITHAQDIRKHIIDSFETALVPGQPEEEIKRLLHFVVVGGGPTGVEFAAELRDWIKEDLRKVYADELLDKAKITLVDGLNKILNTYSEEIQRYTEDKFNNEGIQVITRAFVGGMDENNITYKNAETGEMNSLPYGMCIWCAGIGPRPLTKQIQSVIPEQNNRFGLITDHFLKLKNSKNIFGLGDCATVQFKKFSEYLETLSADIESGVEISEEQMKAMIATGVKRFPHLNHQFKEMERVRGKTELEEGEVFSKEKLLSIANLVDTKQTALPPTAQVAAQEGKYLGKLLNRHAHNLVNDKTDGIAPFKYTHLGSFAYVGDNRAVLEMPIVGSLKGLATMWLWRGMYASECVTLRMRVLVLFDWTKAWLFGRDTSRI